MNNTQLIEKDSKCNSWDYDQSEFTLTIMSEVCSFTQLTVLLHDLLT